MQVIGDRYVVEQQLGDKVFAARDRVLDRRVAIKLIPVEDGDRADGRLVRKARAMARLSHPNVVPVFDVGGAADGPLHVAMELVDGVTLDRWLCERSPDPWTVVGAFRAAAQGLAAGHAAGLPRGDFAPEHVLMGRDGRARVLDFEPGGDDQRSFFDALAAALGDAVPSAIQPVLQRGRAGRFATMDEVAAALRPPSRRGRRIAAAIALAAIGVVLAVLGVVLSGDPPPSRPAAPPGYGCGPILDTYAVEGAGDARGVRCVLFARDPDGRPWLAWYGEGVRDGVRYRHVGEGRLGDAGTVAAIDGEGDGPVRLESALVDTRPPRIAVRGAVDETWIRTAGLHRGYTPGFPDPVGGCGPRLKRYRVVPKWKGFWGSSTLCMMPGGRTWLDSGHWHGNPHLHVGTSTFEDGEPGLVAADICYAPGVACGDAGFGELAMRPRRFRDGEGIDVTGVWPLWLVPAE
jgi:hypothetical protein